MKRFIVLLLIFLSFTFIPIESKSAFAISNVFTEGIYKVTDFNPSKDGIYEFSNVSQKEKIYMVIMDGNQVIQQSILLQPNSVKHVTVPILPNYRVILLGEGQMYFDPQVPK